MTFCYDYTRADEEPLWHHFTLTAFDQTLIKLSEQAGKAMTRDYHIYIVRDWGWRWVWVVGWGGIYLRHCRIHISVLSSSNHGRYVNKYQWKWLLLYTSLWHMHHYHNTIIDDFQYRHSGCRLFHWPGLDHMAFQSIQCCNDRLAYTI